MPDARSTCVKPRTTSTGGADGSTAGATVLIVDDDAVVLEGLARALHGTEYRVVTAAGAWAGVAALRRGPFDIILADQCMPGLTGLDFFGLVRERQPSTVCILFSGNADLKMALQAINSGMVSGFLTKPFERADLLAALSAARSKLQANRENLRLREQAARGPGSR
jgi:DNA-binding NtrC family response regulator